MQSYGSQLTALVICDDLESGKIWSKILEQIDLHVHLAKVTEDVIDIWKNILPDMVIFEDFDLNDEELPICQKLRKLTPIPLLLLTSKKDEKFHLRAYQAGFDECIVQPIHPLIFLAKIRVWMRYSHFIPSLLIEDLKVNQYLLEVQQRRLMTPEGASFQLTYLETNLLVTLMKTPGVPVDPDLLVESIWGRYGGGDKVMLKNVVYRLRRKIEADPEKPTILLTDGRLGYTFSAT